MHYLLALLALILVVRPAHSEEAFHFIAGKQKEKLQSRWNLMDHLSSRRFRGRDQWQAFNLGQAPMFEMILDIHAGSPTFDSKPLPAFKDKASRSGAEISVILGPFGLHIGRDMNRRTKKGSDEGKTFFIRDTGIFSLRLLGAHSQTTGMGLLFGVDKVEHDDWGKADQQFMGAFGSFYFTRRFGIYADYKAIRGSEAHSTDTRLGGYRWVSGIFYDFSLLRLYANYNYDKMLVNPPNNQSYAEVFKGWVGGLRLYF